MWSDTSRESVELGVRESKRGGTRVEAVDDAGAEDMVMLCVDADQTNRQGKISRDVSKVKRDE